MASKLRCMSSYSLAMDYQYSMQNLNACFMIDIFAITRSREQEKRAVREKRNQLMSDLSSTFSMGLRYFADEWAQSVQKQTICDENVRSGIQMDGKLRSQCRYDCIYFLLTISIVIGLWCVAIEKLSTFGRLIWRMQECKFGFVDISAGVESSSSNSATISELEPIESILHIFIVRFNLIPYTSQRSKLNTVAPHQTFYLLYSFIIIVVISILHCICLDSSASVCWCAGVRLLWR